MSLVGSIYALCDPETFSVRYVGQTRGPVSQRVQGHVTGAKKMRRRHRVARWIWSLPCEPAFVVLENDVALEQLDEREAHWVRAMIDSGADLLNGPSTRAVKLNA